MSAVTKHHRQQVLVDDGTVPGLQIRAGKFGDGHRNAFPAPDLEGHQAFNIGLAGDRDFHANRNRFLFMGLVDEGDVLPTEGQGDRAADLGLRHTQQRGFLPVDRDHIAFCIRLYTAVDIHDVRRAAKNFIKPAYPTASVRGNRAHISPPRWAT